MSNFRLKIGQRLWNYFATMSSTLVQRQFQHEYPEKKIPHHHTITSLVKKKSLETLKVWLTITNAIVAQSSQRRCRLMLKVPGTIWKSQPAKIPDVCHSKWVFPGDLCTKLSTVI